jgi:acetoin utilization deacetylase AcuC-like enzyme
MLAMPPRLRSLSFTPRTISPLLKAQKVKANAMGSSFSLLQVLTISTDMSDDELIALEHTRDSIYFNKLTFASSLLSAGGAIETCLAVATRKVKNAIAVIRPPGHHAEHDKTMGFCLFNNVSVAARVCQNTLGESCRKILIVDWYVFLPQ